MIVTVLVEPLDRGVLDRAVDPLDLAVCPRMVRLGQPVLDAVRFADHVEAHRPGIDGVPVARLICELDPVIGQNRVDLVRHSLRHVLEELPGSLSGSRCNELGDGELGSPVDADEHVELAFAGLYLGNV